jgi:cell division protein FtsN
MQTYKMKLQKPKSQPKSYSFTFTLSGLISLCGGVALALSVFFILGILVGRGYRPETKVPELARMMPRLEANQTQVKVDLLKPEELQYQERLKGVGDSAPAAPPAAAAAPAAPAAEAKAEPKPEPKPEPAVAADTTVYNYVYMVASFKEKEMAESLRKKIDAAGLSTAIEAQPVRGATWHRVLVLFTGTPDQTDGMKEKLAPFKLQKPILKTKEPAKR